MTDKKCSDCNKNKPTNEFHKNCARKDGLSVQCKDCVSQRGKRQYKSKREKVKTRAKERYAKNPELKRKRDLRNRYKITSEDYARMLEEQGGVCLICRKSPQMSLCVDHSHSTKKVRGLLCNRCNPMLGYAGDSVDVLMRAAEYLRAA